MSNRVRDYAWILGVTVAALFISALGGLHLVTLFNDGNGITGEEINDLVLLVVNVFTVLAVFFIGRQGKEIRADVNGRLDAKLATMRTDISDDRREDNE